MYPYASRPLHRLVRPAICEMHCLFVVLLTGALVGIGPSEVEADVALRMDCQGYGIGTSTGELIVFVSTSLSGEDAVPGYRQQLFDSAVVGLHSIEPVCTTGTARCMAFSATGEIVTFSSIQEYIGLEFRGGFGGVSDVYQVPGIPVGDELIAVGQIGLETNEIFFGVTRAGLGVIITFHLGQVVADWLGPISESPIATGRSSFGALNALYGAGDN